MVTSTLISLAGVALAWVKYGRPRRAAPAPAGWAQPLYSLSLNKFFFDELYGAAIVAPLRGLSKLSVLFDNGIIDKAVDVAGSLPRWIGAAPRLLHEGVISSYALMMWIGVLFCVLAATQAWW
jgi:NADH:ubiquinone oxidoreductase subunit 5 (subunit L)/multisubunit Na+/H+ antiporter MnhA subunit